MKGRIPGIFLLFLMMLFPGCQQETSGLSSPMPVAVLIIQGQVVDSAGPLAGATVRVQTTKNETLTDEAGRFTLSILEPGKVTVSAWKHGYYCGKVEGVTPPTEGVTLVLRPYQTGDNPDYEWMPPMGGESCYSCKPGVTQVWLDNDAHARSAENPRFLSMYNGMDVHGNQSPPTRFAVDRDYGAFPLPPDLSEPYYGPGYKLDFPDTDGNCAACHTPGAAVGRAYGVDPNQVSGADRFGVHCDFCHKIAAVTLDPLSGLPYDNMPGVLSMDVRRPFPDDPERFQLFFGTFDDDNVPEEDTYLPLIEESAFCAPCHYGVFWDTVVYNSYGEWLASPYSDPGRAAAAGVEAQTCQDCHMPAPTFYEGQPITNVAPHASGVERDPLDIHAHTFPGAASVELLQNALSMAVSAQQEGERLVVIVRLTNDLTGHHVPSDSPLRHLILLVAVQDGDGNPLAQMEGPVVPAWGGGAGDPDHGYYAGLPGKAYAKVLEEVWTQVSPSGAYWNPTRVVSDNRLAALASDESAYAFALPANASGSELTVSVTLLYRRAFKELMDQKGWTDADIVMEQEVLTLHPE